MMQTAQPQVLTVSQLILGGIRTDCVSSPELIDLMIVDCLQARSSAQPVVPRLVFDTNGHAVSLAALDVKYRAALRRADLVHADGQPLVTFSRLIRGGSIPHRTATTDLILDCARAAADNGLSFYLLGGTEEVNAAAALALKARFPRLKIAGRRNGFFSREEEPDICEQISRSGADIVWVGLGKPAEQLFCVRNARFIECGWLVTCGGCFNFLTGAYKRAPKIFQNIGLEWLHRVVANPDLKLAWRYFTSIPHSLFLMVLASRSLPVRHIRPLVSKVDGQMSPELQSDEFV